MQKWTEARPDRLQAEIEAFQNEEGLDFELDRAELEATGRAVFRGTLTRAASAPIELEVRYPDSFPYLRPEVFAPNLQLERHQNPYRHNLCLLEGSSMFWSPSWTGAWLVSVRIPLLLELLEGNPEEMRRQESPQGEPASHYVQRQKDAVVFIPDEMLRLPESERGGIANLSVGVNERPEQILRACLTRVGKASKGKKAEDLARVTGPLAERFSKTQFEGRWVRLDSFPEGRGTGQELWGAATRAPGYETPALQNVPGGKMRILGIVCKEEVRQGEWEDSWLFAVQIRFQEGKQQRESIYVAHGDRVSPRDLAERIPTLKGLAEKTVALAGLGALGGPIAMELSRAQIGELRILDVDYVEAGTVVRWPFGLGVVGRLKTDAIAAYVTHDYPFTKVKGFTHQVGAVATPGGSQQDDSDVLSEFLDGVDLLIDATAEIGIQQLLGALADEAGIPQVYVWATQGGWGGGVARVIPEETGCWYCLQLQLDKSIKLPPFAEAGTVQPRGCTAPTWTGTSFAAMPLVAQAVRTACFTLLGDRAADNPRDVFICDQKAEQASELDAPRWASYVLQRDQECRCCGAARNQ